MAFKTDLRNSLALETDGAVSPLSEATVDSIDDLLHQFDQNLIEGMPEKITDSRLLKLVTLYRAQAAKWAIDEKEKKPRGKPKAKGTDSFDIGEVIDI